MPISLGLWEWRFPKRGDVHITVTPGLERYSLVPGFEQNTVRDSGSLWLGTGFDCYPGGGIRPNLGTNAGLGKKTISVRMAMMEVRDAVFSWKGARMRDRPPPPPSFSLFRPYNMDSLGTKIRLVELFKSQLLNPSRPSPPPPPPLRPYRWETWYFYQSSSFLMLLGCLRQNRYHRWEIFKVINTEYLYLC